MPTLVGVLSCGGCRLLVGADRWSAQQLNGGGDEGLCRPTVGTLKRCTVRPGIMGLPAGGRHYPQGWRSEALQYAGRGRQRGQHGIEHPPWWHTAPLRSPRHARRMAAGPPRAPGTAPAQAAATTGPVPRPAARAGDHVDRIGRLAERFRQRLPLDAVHHRSRVLAARTLPPAPLRAAA